MKHVNGYDNRGGKQENLVSGRGGGGVQRGGVGVEESEGKAGKEERREGGRE